MPLDGTVRSIQSAATESDGRGVVLTSHDVIGYRTVHYETTGSKSGRVRLQFVSAESTIDGKETLETGLPPLPFRLPKGSMHVRLVYLTRLSASDHNMAMLAAKDKMLLDSFTEEFQRDPSICGEGAKVFCTWVPSEVALRPER